MLYDTGASATVISDTVWEQLKDSLDNVHMKKVKLQLYGAGGTKLRILGVYLVPMTIFGQSKRITIHVVQGLQEDAILGVNGIKTFGLHFDALEGKCFIGEVKKRRSDLICAKGCTILPGALRMIKVRPLQKLNCIGHVAMATVSGLGNPNANVSTLCGGAQLTRLKDNQSCFVRVFNPLPYSVEVGRGSHIGVIESIDDCIISEIKPEEVDSKNCELEQRKGSAPTQADKEFVRNNVRIEVPDSEKEAYMDLLYEFHDIFSRSKMDLGRTDSVEHKIQLKDLEPVYQRQFRLPESHRQELEKHVTEWLKLGIIQPSRSRYNSPMFMVAKKDGSLRPVQDFRALNAQSMDDKYSMRDITECIDEIGFEGSSIFSTLDLTSGFWQMLLEQHSRPLTAFTVPGMGQFHWITSPMGLLGCPASFQRLMELVTMNLKGVIAYIDDLLIHSHNHKEHRDRLRRVFRRLRGHGLKINLKKCEFGAKEVSYLGFRLTPEGIFPGLEKTDAIRKAKPPQNPQEVRQFLGLCNFFRNHIPDFARRTGELCKLTKKGVKWKGECPEEARQEFEDLQQALCNKPMLHYPRIDWDYKLFTDASTGTDTAPGGLGAMLCQINPKDGNHYVLGYASRRLQLHEKNYSSFLLEQAAAVWGMEHFSVYLKGRRFTLITDHKPLETLGKIHTKTLRRLQEVMLDYTFDIEYLKGSEMPADYLSRCQTIGSIVIDRNVQEKDNDFPRKELELENQVWVHKTQGAIFVPQDERKKVLEFTHDHQLAGHKGINQTMKRIEQKYWWPGWREDVKQYIQKCTDCVQKRISNPEKKIPIRPNALVSEPNQRIHVDLFGPIKNSNSGNKYVLVMTDAFTKYLETVAIPDKEALTVASALYNKWICRFGIPDLIASDGGKEFVNKMSDELYSLLNIRRLTTSAYHPQCNSQAEVINKSLSRYMRAYLEDHDEEWEFYLPSMTYSYNTSHHRSIGCSPFLMTFGYEARGPETGKHRQFFEMGEANEWIARFHRIRQEGCRHLMINQDKTAEYYNQDKTGKPVEIGQAVWLDHHQFLGKTQKFSHHWKGPYKVTRIINQENVEVENERRRRWIVHKDRIRLQQKEKEENRNNDVNKKENNVTLENPETDEGHHTGDDILREDCRKGMEEDEASMTENQPKKRKRKEIPPMRIMTRSRAKKIAVIGALGDESPTKLKEREFWSKTKSKQEEQLKEEKIKEEQKKNLLKQRAHRIKERAPVQEASLWDSGRPRTNKSWKNQEAELKIDRKYLSGGADSEDESAYYWDTPSAPLGDKEEQEEQWCGRPSKSRIGKQDINTLEEISKTKEAMKMLDAAINASMSVTQSRDSAEAFQWELEMKQKGYAAATSRIRTERNHKEEQYRRKTLYDRATIFTQPYFAGEEGMFLNRMQEDETNIIIRRIKSQFTGMSNREALDIVNLLYVPYFKLLTVQREGRRYYAVVEKCDNEHDPILKPGHTKQVPLTSSPLVCVNSTESLKSKQTRMQLENISELVQWTEQMDLDETGWEKNATVYQSAHEEYEGNQFRDYRAADSDPDLQESPEAYKNQQPPNYQDIVNSTGSVVLSFPPTIETEKEKNSEITNSDPEKNMLQNVSEKSKENFSFVNVGNISSDPNSEEDKMEKDPLRDDSVDMHAQTSQVEKLQHEKSLAKSGQLTNEELGAGQQRIGNLLRSHLILEKDKLQLVADYIIREKMLVNCDPVEVRRAAYKSAEILFPSLRPLQPISGTTLEALLKLIKKRIGNTLL